ncbi:MAG: chorismate synthase [Acidobacteria bacterium]|nr:chorismate synthase [Acidobacteriota bacterium]
MASNSFGEILRVTTFGESHGPGIGVVVDGYPPAFPVDLAAIQREMDRRRPGQSGIATPRQEKDRVEVLSGLFEGRTTGAPLTLWVRNDDARPSDYDDLRDRFRPGHADYTWWRKYGVRDHRGGGRTSGRETAARVAAGALVRQLLAPQGISVTGHVVRVGPVWAEAFDPTEIERNPVRCADAQAARRMADVIGEARDAGDSVGGIVEVRADGVPAGLGDPVFGKLEARLGAAFLSIGAVKGVEFGDGFALAGMRGSEANDALRPGGFATNHAGGTLGGISTGATVVARLAVKPASSIARPQDTVDVDGNPVVLEVRGRHDPCICPRLVPVAEAMACLVLGDAWLRQRPYAAGPPQIEEGRISP